MKKFTVVLRRPKGLSEAGGWTEFDAERESYVAHVDAPDVSTAVREAKNQVRRFDRAPGVKAKDYVTLLVFEGKHEPVLFGWQAGVDS